MTRTDKYHPVLLNQENFLLKGNKYKVKQCLSNSKVIFKQAEKDSLEGRPKNGMFIAVPEEIEALVKDVSPNNWRVQAITVSVPNNRLLILNTYFPTDPQVNDFDTGDFLSTLATIDEVIKQNQFDNLIWGGDINADFMRKTFFTKNVDNFISQASLKKAWDLFEIDFTHVSEIRGNTTTSTLDHFFWSESISDNVSYADVMHIPENTSDHSPIYCIIDTGSLIHKRRVDTKAQPKPSWKKASEIQRQSYISSVEARLQEVEITNVKSCNDVHCQRTDHIDDIDNMTKELLTAVNIAADKHLPKPVQKSEKEQARIANWNKEIEPYKDSALFWHSIWQSCGRPINTEVHRVMKKTRNIYHFQIRKHKRMTDKLKRNSLLQACISEKSDIFEEIKKIRRTKTTVSSTIDGVEENVENHFSQVYKKLYTSVDDTNDLSKLQKLVKCMITSSSLIDVDMITPEIIIKAMAHMKNDKSDPIFQYSSTCLKNTPDIFAEKLCSLFKMFFIHGHISSFLVLSTLIPLVKDKLGDISDSNNYRSIALGSLILKILDWVIILLYGENLKTDELQFGFQPKTSTTMCTWLAVETIDYFLRKGSNVYVCVMDLTKAFDLVKHSVLFQKLINRGLSPICIRLLLNIYMNQQANVLWNGRHSDRFPILNGVKQGAVLSPLLFCVYIDELFSILRKKKDGCWVKKEFHGIVGYADDLLLMAPTLEGLQKMITTCEDFAKRHNLKFSTNVNETKSKTKCMAFTKKDVPLKKMVLNGNDLPWTKSFKHLGTKIVKDLKGLKQDLMEKRAIYIKKTNELMQEFHYSHPLTKVRINGIFNISFYGSPLWNLFSPEAVRLEKTWNVSHRIMLQVPRETHRYFIEPLTETQHIKFALLKRFLRFVDSVSSSKKGVLKNMLAQCKYDCQSTTGENLRKAMLLTGNTQIDEIKIQDIDKLAYNGIPDGEGWRIALAKDLIEAIVEGRETILTRTEAEELLRTVVT